MHVSSVKIYRFSHNLVLILWIRTGLPGNQQERSAIAESFFYSSESRSRGLCHCPLTRQTLSLTVIVDGVLRQRHEPVKTTFSTQIVPTSIIYVTDFYQLNEFTHYKRTRGHLIFPTSRSVRCGIASGMRTKSRENDRAQPFHILTRSAETERPSSIRKGYY